MSKFTMKLIVGLLTIIVFGQWMWIALDERPSVSSCPVVDHEGLAHPTPIANPQNNSKDPTLAYDAAPGRQARTAEQYSPVVAGPSSFKLASASASASAQSKVPTSDGHNSWPAASLKHINQSLKDLSAKLRHTTVDGLIVIAILMGALLLSYFWAKRPSRNVALSASPAEVFVEPREERQSGLWIIEVNLDEASRQKIFRAIRFMGLRVLRRGKYSLALGNYTDKIEASRIVQKLYKRYGVRGWLVDAPANSTRSDRFKI